MSKNLDEILKRLQRGASDPDELTFSKDIRYAVTAEEAKAQLQSLVKECIPAPRDGDTDMMIGFEWCIEEITNNLKLKGLL